MKSLKDELVKKVLTAKKNRTKRDTIIGCQCLECPVKMEEIASQILSAIKERLPEERDLHNYPPTSDKTRMLEVNHFNQAIREIKSILGEE